MKTIVINLKDRTDRLEQFKHEWGWIGDFEISEGIRHKVPHTGCGLGHINAIEKALKTHEWCLILEDDAVLNCSRNDFLDCINNAILHYKEWDAVFLGAIGHNQFPHPIKLKRMNENFFTASRTKSLRSCAAMLWTKSALPKLEEYKRILLANLIFPIDRMLTSYSYPWKCKGNEDWDEDEEFFLLLDKPRVWIHKKCLVQQRHGSYSDNLHKPQPNYENDQSFTQYLYDLSRIDRDE